MIGRHIVIASIPVLLLGGCMVATGEAEREDLILREEAALQQPCEMKTMIIRRIRSRIPPAVSTETTLQQPACGRTGVIIVDR